MTNLVAINYSAHKHLKIDTAKTQEHSAAQHMLPVVVAEFSQVSVQHPIVLAKSGETGEFTLTALLGFEQHENLFSKDGQWQGVYIPLQLQRQPFFVGDIQTEVAGDYAVCINLDSPSIVRDSVQNNVNDIQLLFTDSGEDSDYFVKMKQCLGYLLQGEIENKALIDTLLALNLVQPLSLDVTFSNKQSSRLNGLYTVSEEKVAALDAEQIGRLHKAQQLKPIYTMINSLGQLYPLIERKNQQLVSVHD
ncbi:MAG: SapC family protein [Pseudoalteromonas prydzensis]|uniref:SapC family protein n=1 Tax=Pseudoalteromonas prydzensis TaxID=182141 RepID=UPI003F9905F5